MKDNQTIKTTPDDIKVDYFNLLADTLFKRVFKEEPQCKDLTLDFINSALGYTPDSPDFITSINFDDPELVPANQNNKTQVLDILGCTQKGELVNLELQAVNHKYFDARMLLYLLSILNRQVHKGDRVVNYQRTIMILILGFNLEDWQAPDNCYYTSYGIIDHKHPSYALSKLLEFHVFQTRKFLSCMQGKEFEDMNKLERFIMLFCKHYSIEELEAMAQIDENTKKILDTFKVFRQDSASYSAYVQDELDRMTYETDLHYARQEGEEQGIAKGRAEGRAEGEAIGEDRGRRETNLENARKMKAKKYDFAEISEITGLSTAEIAAL